MNEATTSLTRAETLTLRDEAIKWPWCVAAPMLRDVTYLRITAAGSWIAAGEQLMPFPPDGHMGLPIHSDKLLLPDTPVGALIGRIGGSSASLVITPSATGDALLASQTFAIGSHCVIAVPERLLGPLFVGFNWKPRPIMVKELTVSVFGAAPG